MGSQPVPLANNIRSTAVHTLDLTPDYCDGRADAFGLEGKIQVYDASSHKVIDGGRLTVKRCCNRCTFTYAPPRRPWLSRT